MFKQHNNFLQRICGKNGFKLNEFSPNNAILVYLDEKIT